MKTKTIFKRKAKLSLLFSALILTGVVGCKKGTFDVNTNPNSPVTVAPTYLLSAALASSASYMHGGNVDVLQNWMGYWMQSGGYTPSTTYVLYQITSSDYTGNFDNAYLNLENYNNIIKQTAGNPSLVNYKAISLIMEAFIFQRVVDLYNKIPYSSALEPNSTFSYAYDQDPKAIYASLVNKCDSAITIITNSTATDGSSKATLPGIYDAVFKSSTNPMADWKTFAKTLKLKLLMRQTEAGLGSDGVKAALAGYTSADFLAKDAGVDPGYSSGSNAQLNPFYLDVFANSTGGDGSNTNYYRANAYAVKFFQDNNDPRGNYVYAPIGSSAYAYKTPINDLTKIRGRVYGTANGNGEANSAISAIVGTGFTAAGAQKGPSQPAMLITATESLFLQAEAVQRGYLTGDPATAYNAAVAASFTFLGAPGASTYTSQVLAATNYALASNKLELIITQKWAAMNTIDPLESYSDWRRTGYPLTLPVSIYPGVTVTHIPYRFPYPVNETSLNGANVPADGRPAGLFTDKIFWMK